jgi:hypothetical protein
MRSLTSIQVPDEEEGEKWKVQVPRELTYVSQPPKISEERTPKNYVYCAFLV